MCVCLFVFVFLCVNKKYSCFKKDGPNIIMLDGLAATTWLFNDQIGAAIRWEMDALIIGSFGALCADFDPVLSGSMFINVAKSWKRPFPTQKRKRKIGNGRF